MTEKTFCPKCSSTRKKSHLKTRSVTGNVFFCHHCGDRGYIDDKGKDINVSQESSPKTPPMDQSEALKGKLPKKIIEWFGGRGISLETLQKNKIEFEKGCIKFPYFWNKELVNIKYRSLDKKFHQVPERDKVFYGLDDIAGQDEIIITEGEIDKLSFYQADYVNAASVPDGAPTPNAKTFASKFKFIDNCVHVFQDAKKIILAVDNDAPGWALQQELIRRLDPVKCWKVIWPEGCKDANEVLVKLGIEGLINLIEGAILIPIKGIYAAADFRQEIDAEWTGGGLQPGVSTGINSLDHFYTVKESQITVVTGIPSHGKSSLLTAINLSIAKEHGWNFAVFSPENNPVSHFVSRMMAIYVGKPFNKGINDRMTAKEKDNAISWLDSRFKFLMPGDDAQYRIDDILSLAKICVQRYGVKGIIIDPWNEIDHTRDGNLSETEYISQSLTKIRAFSRVYQVHVWIVAHPMKPQKDKASGKYPPPTAYDIQGSSHWRNKADNILCVYRDEMDEAKSVQVHIQKIRFKNIGRPGLVHVRYDSITGRYDDLTKLEVLAGGKL